MFRRSFAVVAGLTLALSAVAPAFAAPRSTTELTIDDYQGGDNLLEYGPGENYLVLDATGAVASDQTFRPPRTGSILNFLQLTDFQLVDEESPGRVEFLDPTQRGGFNPVSAAYRPQESLGTQSTEAMVRSARNTISPITGKRLELSILTGDNADSQQYNETRWFIDIMDGTTGVRPPGFTDVIDPDSGIPVPGCEATPGSLYDGVRGGGQQGAPDLGYYEPDFSGPNSDGDGYSPIREENEEETPGRDVTVRDFPGLFEAAQRPFEALGIGMPWYTAFGNHDALIQGNSPEAYFGPGLPFSTPTQETADPAFHGIATGCFKPETDEQLTLLTTALADGNISPEEEDQLLAESTPIVPPDARRCYVAKDEVTGGGAAAPCDSGGWVQQHFATTGVPVGHGLAPAAGCPAIVTPVPPADATECTAYGRPPIADFYNDGYYSFSPKTGLRFIVLDTVTDECGTLLCSEGSIDDPQFQWLTNQIGAAEALGQYVVVFSHHTFKTTRFPSADTSEYPMHYGQRVDPEDPTNPQGVSAAQTLEELYCEHPAVIAHVAGHEHSNKVLRYDCKGNTTTPDGSISSAVGPGDFWHISTAAEIDWPQQSRMIELVNNGNGTMSLVLTMLDHAGPPNPGLGRDTSFDKGMAGEQVLKLASVGREIAFNDYQASRAARGEPADRNVILPVARPWPAPTP